MTVLLETKPDPEPAANPAPGHVTLIEDSGEAVVLEATLQAPAILLITDAYSKHWHARPVVTGPQSAYQIMPADYALSAIPLAAGQHVLRLEYAPTGLTVGRWISISAAAILVFIEICVLFRIGKVGKEC